MKKSRENQAAIAKEYAQPGLERFQKEFFCDRHDEFKLLRIALVKNDYLSIKRMAHKWKGFCAPYGFQGLGALSVELENAAGIKSDEACRAVSQKIGNYFTAKSKKIGIQLQ